MLFDIIDTICIIDLFLGIGVMICDQQQACSLSSLIGLPIASIAYYRSYDLYHQSVASSRWNAFRLYKRFPAFGLAYSLGVISSSFLFDLPNSPVNHGVAGTIAAYTFRNSLKWSGQVVKSGPGSGIKFFCGALCAGGFMATLKLIAITSPDLKEEPQLYLNPLHWRKGSTPLYNDIDERRLKYAKLNESFIDYQMERNKEFENQYIKDSRDYK
ncbi:hypothetical protein ACOME3_009592 [Neoechinorhynchus agilis]